MSQLEKRSKNVRLQTTYEQGDPSKGVLKPATIDRRQKRYLQGIGLKPEADWDTPDDAVALTPKKNRIGYERTDEGLLTMEHEGLTP